MTEKKETKQDIPITEEKRHSETPNDTAENVPPTIDDPDAAQDYVASLEEQVEALKAEVAENRDRFLRAGAELENFKKRTAREMDDLRRFATEQVFKDILPIIDDLERAVHSCENGESANGITEGVRLTLNELHKMFEKYRVTPIDSLEKPFDPNFHQAVLQEESEQHPDNTVIREFQKGYMMDNRLLRPAMVVVSKNVAPAE